MKFAPEYVTYVLNENFEDAKELFLAPLMAIHYAHLAMLAAQGIVSAQDAHRIREALDSVSLDEVRRAKYDGSCEDLFFYVERLITGTGFPIDRQATSELLGFCGPTGNTYGSIATADYLLESTSAASVLLAGLGRFVQDLLLWCTAEFDYMRLGEGYVQCSSIMPQ